MLDGSTDTSGRGRCLVDPWCYCFAKLGRNYMLAQSPFLATLPVTLKSNLRGLVPSHVFPTMNAPRGRSPKVLLQGYKQLQGPCANITGTRGARDRTSQSIRVVSLPLPWSIRHVDLGGHRRQQPCAAYLGSVGLPRSCRKHRVREEHGTHT